MTWPNPNTHPEFYDPFASAERHPQLPAGLNADDVNGDVIDGGGTNWPIWPMLFDAYEPERPIILDAEKLEVFDGCPDFNVGAVPDCVLMPSEQMLIDIGGTWPDIVPPALQATIMIAHETAEQKIRNVSAIFPNSGTNTVPIAQGRRVQETRRPA
jgi:hypothetical protein